MEAVMADDVSGITPATEAPEAPATRADMLREQFDALEAEQAKAAEPAATEAPKLETAAEETERLGRTAGRPRDPQGRLLPGKPVLPHRPAAESAKPAQPPTTLTEPIAPAAAPVPAPAPIPRPSTWKKEHWDNFDKLARENPALAQYINQRESEYARGVSTYKAEWDKAKPFLEAVQPHIEEFKKYGIDPAQQFSVYANLHRTLALGSEQEKLTALYRIVNDYKIPVQNLFTRGDDGQIYYNQSLQQAAAHAQQQQAAPQQRQADPRETVRSILAEERALSAVEQMAQDAQTYPHYERFKDAMAGVLQAGLAQDLPEAYEVVKRLPQNSDIFDAEQAQARQADDERKRAEGVAAAARARKNAFSPASATPTASAASATTGKSRRDVIAELVNSHESGRV